MTMIFRHGVFHGDPHPANILVMRPDQIGLVDFGLAGAHGRGPLEGDRLFIDVANENVEALPKRLADLGVRYPKENEDEFVAELQELFYRYYGASLAEIDPLQVIREVFSLIYQLNLHLPTRFMLLDKSIATLGSVGVELYPDFNVFEVARPYARSLMVVATRRSACSRARSGTAGSSRRSSASTCSRSTTCWSRRATARSRSASCTRGSTTSCTPSTSRSTA